MTKRISARDRIYPPTAKCPRCNHQYMFHRVDGCRKPWCTCTKKNWPAVHIARLSRIAEVYNIYHLK